jgi:hypothetical protein
VLSHFVQGIAGGKDQSGVLLDANLAQKIPLADTPVTAADSPVQRLTRQHRMPEESFALPRRRQLERDWLIGSML